ncbi:site-specific integrase [Limnobaculum xujianqingii]|uniref:site-specific integrase n=1 Tax=Limnobaculum xujianqingii TaxID=2738837 RepID=UPI00112A888C|nr:site-specific integrase [Limnobaculum xujianqingii]
MNKKITYPTGVENHGGFLRIWFMYQGERVREPLSIPDTPKNRKDASELRQSVTYAIKTGNFDYLERFPNSKQAKKLIGNSVNDISIGTMFDKFLRIKQPEISLNAMRRYICKLETCGQIIGKDRLITSITGEDLLNLRNELLTGKHRPARRRKTLKIGRTVATVNDYMTCVASVFKFAYANDYIGKNPMRIVTKLKRSKDKPDPLTTEEFERFINACLDEQTINLWTVAFYTGMRHGEICALSWEDIDLIKETITVRRNWTSVKQFTLPKTDAGTDRAIQLLKPALDALKKQQALTRLNEKHDVIIHLREYGKTRKDQCTFVFSPMINAKGNNAGVNFAATSLGDNWDRIIKRAKLRHRNAYQSRHTYACWSLSAGANPTFIASQMGHSSAQMLYSVYGDWMPEQSANQISLLNEKLSKNVPSIPHKKYG